MKPSRRARLRYQLNTLTNDELAAIEAQYPLAPPPRPSYPVLLIKYTAFLTVFMIAGNLYTHRSPLETFVAIASAYTLALNLLTFNHILKRLKPANTLIPA